MIQEVENVQASKARDHLANERTFLSWVRTSIGIMAFGFVVEKFALFVKQINFFLSKAHLAEAGPTQLSSSTQGYSSVLGVCLVALGALICLLAFIRYKTIEKEIENETYRPSTLLDIMLTLSVLSIGILLLIYLFSSI